MLHLINRERTSAGLNRVVLGDNPAAQTHAESSLANCFSGHWGIDGLLPYMRYSLLGGYQSNGENVSGSNYCIRSRDGYRAIASIDEEIREAMDGLLASEGHRRQILDESHRKVNIGLAWDRYNFLAVQQFEGDYVEYAELPSIEDGVLTISGTTKNGLTFRNAQDLGLQIYYHQPPHALTRGQLARTYCADAGLQIAGLRPEPPPRSFYTEDEYVLTYKPCLDPYDIPAGAGAPRSHDEAHEYWHAAYDASRTAKEVSVVVPWITAERWRVQAESFEVQVDIGDLLAQHGPGVYSLKVWNMVGDPVVFSEYSLFHEIPAPLEQEDG